MGFLRNKMNAGTKQEKSEHLPKRGIILFTPTDVCICFLAYVTKEMKVSHYKATVPVAAAVVDSVGMRVQMQALSFSETYSDTQLHVLTPVHLHPLIQKADFLKVLPVHHKAANQGWTPTVMKEGQ